MATYATGQKGVPASAASIGWSHPIPLSNLVFHGLGCLSILPENLNHVIDLKNPLLWKHYSKICTSSTISGASLGTPSKVVSVLPVLDRNVVLNDSRVYSAKYMWTPWPLLKRLAITWVDTAPTRPINPHNYSPRSNLSQGSTPVIPNLRLQLFRIFSKSKGSRNTE